MADARRRGAHSGTVQRLPRLLVLDDDRNCLEVARRWFERAGFDVVTVENLQQAIGAFEARPFDAFITDMWLPDGCAADLMKALSERNLAPPPTVCVSGDGDAARNPVWAFVPPTNRPIRFFDKPAEFSRVEAVVEAMRRRPQDETAVG